MTNFPQTATASSTSIIKGNGRVEKWEVYLLPVVPEIPSGTP